MSIAHLHLALNHFPLFGIVIIALRLVIARYRRSSELGKVSLALAVLVGAVSVAVYFTGEPAEALIEKLPGFSEAITERHEDAALVATIIVAGLGALALGTLTWHRGGRALSRRVNAAALMLAVGAGSLMGYTAYLGGQVRHTEVRPAGASAAGAAVESNEMGTERTPVRAAPHSRDSLPSSRL